MGHFYTSNFKVGTLLHIWKKQLGYFYTSGRSNWDTFTHLEEAIGILLHIWKKLSGHFYTSGRHKTIHLGRFYTTNEKTSNKREIKT